MSRSTAGRIAGGPKLAAALGLGLSIAVGAAGCGRKEDRHAITLPDNGRAQVVEVALASPPGEGGERSVLSAPNPRLARVLRVLREVAGRDRIKGLFLRLGPMGGAWGRASDLVGALDRIRRAGKVIHCHFDEGDNVSMLVLASACDRISMTPAGTLDLVGPALQVFYAKNLLDKIGVQAQLLQMGRYKGAADPFTLERMPPPVRESLTAILDDLRVSLVHALTAHRHLSAAQAEQAIDGGPYDSTGAQEAGLVDAVEYADAAREHAREAAHAPHVLKARLAPEAESIGLGDILSALSGKSASHPPSGPRIALMNLEGTIVDAPDAGMRGIRSGPVIRAMHRMADDDDVKAVVLRIASPGGSALASDQIWHAVRRIAKRKPVIASVGDMAASGGYYIASAATKILASDDSLVGSIGVVGGKVQLTELAEKIGVHVEVLKRGEHAAWTSPFEPMTDAERQILEHMLETTYRRFLRRVASGRDIPVSRVRAAAEGRLWTGKQGRRLGLVDQAGGLADALALARKSAHLPTDAPVQQWPPPKSLLDALAQAMGGDGAPSTEALVRAAGPLAAPLVDALPLPALLARERIALALPFVVRIQ